MVKATTEHITWNTSRYSFSFFSWMGPVIRMKKLMSVRLLQVTEPSELFSHLISLSVFKTKNISLPIELSSSSLNVVLLL